MRSAPALAVRARTQMCSDQDRGFATVEAVVVIPVTVILTMVVIQFVMVWHARNLAEAAAQDGLRAGRGYQATAAQGQASAVEYLHNTAAGLLVNPRVDAHCTPTRCVVTVRATVTSVIPFGTFTVLETASGPVEKFT